jgi:hypothetical protein
MSTVQDDKLAVAARQIQSVLQHLMFLDVRTGLVVIGKVYFLREALSPLSMNHPMDKLNKLCTEY